MEYNRAARAGPVRAPSRRRAVRIVTLCVMASVLALVIAAASWHWLTSTRKLPSSGQGPHSARLLIRPQAMTSGAVAYTDPWGTPLEYVYPGVMNEGGYDLISWGPDRRKGGGDDIANYRLPGP